MTVEERCPHCGDYRALPRILHDDPDNPAECTDAFHKSEAPAQVLEFPSPAPEVAEPPVPEPAAVPQTQISKPLCPYCGVRGKLNAKLTTFGGIEVMIVACGNPDCEKILFGFQPLRMQMIQPPPPPSTMPH